MRQVLAQLPPRAAITPPREDGPDADALTVDGSVGDREDPRLIIILIILILLITLIILIILILMTRMHRGHRALRQRAAPQRGAPTSTSARFVLSLSGTVSPCRC